MLCPSYYERLDRSVPSTEYIWRNIGQYKTNASTTGSRLAALFRWDGVISLVVKQGWGSRQPGFLPITGDRLVSARVCPMTVGHVQCTSLAPTCSEIPWGFAWYRKVFQYSWGVVGRPSRRLVSALAIILTRRINTLDHFLASWLVIGQTWKLCWSTRRYTYICVVRHLATCMYTLYQNLPNSNLVFVSL